MRNLRGMSVRRSWVIETDAGFWLVLGLMLLLFPLMFLAGVLLAALIHETGHILAIRLTGGCVERLQLRAWGARIIAEPMTPEKEALCALSGPAAGMLTLLAWKAFPELALAGLVQTVFNLLPIYPLDGGRAVRNICCKCRRFRVQ